MDTVIVPLWRGSEDLPVYSRDQYTEFDVARVRALVYKCLPNRPHDFVVICDEYYYNRIGEIQSALIDSQTGFTMPDGDCPVMTPEEEIESGPPYVKVRPSPLNWLEGVGLMCFSGKDVGGWSKIMEGFYLDPAPGSRHVMMGLDTIPVGDLSWLFDWNEAPVGLPQDPLYTSLPCNAVISYNNVGADIMRKAYASAASSGMSTYLLNGCPSEMMLMRDLWKRHGWPFLEKSPSKLLSYGVHVSKTVGAFVNKSTEHKLESASAVYFHGRHKPSKLSKDSPLGKIWNSV